MRHQRTVLLRGAGGCGGGASRPASPAATVPSIPSCEACAIIGRLKEPPRRRCDGDQGAPTSGEVSWCGCPHPPCCAINPLPACGERPGGGAATARILRRGRARGGGLFGVDAG